MHVLLDTGWGNTRIAILKKLEKSGQSHNDMDVFSISLHYHNSWRLQTEIACNHH